MVRLRSGVKTRESDATRNAETPQVTSDSAETGPQASKKTQKSDGNPLKKAKTHVAVGDDDEADALGQTIIAKNQVPVTEKKTRPRRNSSITSASNDVIAKLPQINPKATDTPKADTETSKKGEGRDVHVHRCSFVDFKPESVEAIAGNGSVLAFARSSGLIELWHRQPNGLQLMCSLPGTRSQGLRCLLWKNDRLFGGNLDGTTFEIDFTLRSIEGVENFGGGGVWGMDVGDQFIATATEDGKLRIFSPKENGKGLDLVKTLSGSFQHRLLCVKFDRCAPNEFIFTGGMDANIRKWSIKQKRVIDVITIPSLSRSVSVWSMDMVGDVLACGDSLGRVHVWTNAGQGTVQTFAEHKADVLVVKLSADGKALFASGVDSRVAAFRFVHEKWVYVYSHRAHTHDVRALGIVDKENDELLCSGGVDAQIISYPTMSFERARPRKYSPFPQEPCVSVADACAEEQLRLVLIKHTTYLELWSLQIDDQSNEHLATVTFDDDTALRCAVIARDGAHLAVADDAHGLSVYSIALRSSSKIAENGPDDDLDEERNKDPVVLRKLRLDSQIDRRSIRSLMFGGSQSTLAVGTTEGLSLIDLESESVLKTIQMSGTVIQIACSFDGQWLAAVLAGTSPSDSNAIELVSLDAMRLHSTLPGALFASPCSAMAFTDDSQTLVVARNNSHLYGFQVDEGFKEVWNVRLAPALSDRVIGICQNPGEPDRVTPWSWSTLVSAARRSDSVTARFVKKFKPIIFAAFVKSDELFVLESPFVNALKHLPDVIESEKYGT